MSAHKSIDLKKIKLYNFNDAMKVRHGTKDNPTKELEYYKLNIKQLNLFNTNLSINFVIGYSKLIISCSILFVEIGGGKKLLGLFDRV